MSKKKKNLRSAFVQLFSEFLHMCTYKYIDSNDVVSINSIHHEFALLKTDSYQLGLFIHLSNSLCLVKYEYAYKNSTFILATNFFIE